MNDKTFDEIINADISQWPKDTFWKSVCEQMDHKKLNEELDRLSLQRTKEWSELANKVVGAE